MPSPMDHKTTFAAKEPKRRIVYGVVYEPEHPDLQGDWASPEQIEQAAHQFLADFGRTNVEHADEAPGVRVVESYIAPADIQLGEQTIRKGSWVVAVKVANNEVWRMVESGELTGFSMQGVHGRRS